MTIGFGPSYNIVYAGTTVASVSWVVWIMRVLMSKLSPASCPMLSLPPCRTIVLGQL